MEAFSSWFNPSLDYAYSYPGKSQSPASVLAEVIGVYVIMGKLVGLLFLLLWLVGIDLYKNITMCLNT